MLLEILFFLVLVPILLSLAYQIYIETPKAGKPPIVRSYIPVLGSGISFGKDPLGFLKKCQARYGDIFTIIVPGWKMTFLMNPSDYPAFFRQKEILQFKPAVVPIEMRAFGYSLEESYRFHDRLPNLWSTHFAGKALDALAARVQTTTQSLVAELKQQDKITQGKWMEIDDLNEVMQSLTYKIGTEALYGDDFPLTSNDSMRRDLRHFHHSLSLMASNVPKFLLKRAFQTVANFTDFFADNKAYPNQSSLISTRQSWYLDDPNIPRSDIGGTYFAMFAALHSNSPVATFWVIYYLLKHPEAYIAVRNEVDQFWKNWEIRKKQQEKEKQEKEENSNKGNTSRDEKKDDIDENDGANLSRESLKELVLLESAINETMRLASSIAIMRVCCVDEYTLPNSPYKLEKGDFVFLFSSNTHYDPELFPDPQVFKYNRFVEDLPEEEKRTKYINPYKNGEKIANTFLPFGGGMSICPGRFFAMMEVKILCMFLLHELDWELADPSAPFAAFDFSHGTLGLSPPVGKIPCRYRKRQF